jgi:hypothetical protein
MMCAAMKLLLDILQGAGLATATGMRPFLPALLAGALASADLGLDFDGTQFAFLESPLFLLALAVGLVVSLLLRARLESGAGEAALAGIGIGLGALLFAGSLDDRFDTWWPGVPAGIACALLGSVATRALLNRVRGRLDAEARAALPLYPEGAAALLAGAAVLAPPLSLVAVAFLAFLQRGGKRRAGEKYAGLRILR